MRAAWLVALGLSGCVWSAQDMGGSSTGGTEDEVVKAACVVEPPNISGQASHDFGAQAQDPAFKARVMAFADPGATGPASVLWVGSGTVGSAQCATGQTVTFVVLP